MTVATEYYDWSKSGLEPGDAPYNTCSPALRSLFDYLDDRWDGQNIGCYHVRDIAGTITPSNHSYGAALDWRYENPGPGRDEVVQVVIPWLIANSAQLGLQAIHDYVGSRIWRANRSGDKNGGWRTQKPTASNNMGNESALWLHLEVTRRAWSDGRAVIERLRDNVAPEAVFAPVHGKFGSWPDRNKPTLRRPANGDAVMYAQGVLRKARYHIAVDGAFGVQTEDRVRRFQRANGLKVDGVVGPVTWAALDDVAVR